MRASTFGLAIAILAGGTATQAETWRRSSGGMGATAYIDTDSLQRTGDNRTFWREVRWPEVRTLDGGMRFNRIAALYEADCRAMTLRPLQMRVSLNSQVLANHPGSGEVERPPPGSNGEIDLRAVCFDRWPQ